MIQRLGAGTLLFENMPRVAGYAAVVGKKESEGPLGGFFDKVIFDSRGGAPTFEEAESLLTEARHMEESLPYLEEILPRLPERLEPEQQRTVSRSIPERDDR